MPGPRRRVWRWKATEPARCRMQPWLHEWTLCLDKVSAVRRRPIGAPEGLEVVRSRGVKRPGRACLQTQSRGHSVGRQNNVLFAERYTCAVTGVSTGLPGAPPKPASLFNGEKLGYLVHRGGEGRGGAEGGSDKRGVRVDYHRKTALKAPMLT